MTEKKKLILLLAMLVLTVTSVVHAQTASKKVYAYVQQDGVKIDALGTAAFELSDKNFTLEFDEKDQACIQIGDVKVAVLPMNNYGQLVVESRTNLSGRELNKVSKTVSAAGYATLYSPFNLKVPQSCDVKVFAPTYSDNKVRCNSSTLVEGEKIIPQGTGLLLMNEGTIDFTISGEQTTYTATNVCLKGSALTIPTSSVNVPSGSCLYTLGHDKTDTSKFGFYKYSGQKLKAGYAYMVESETSSATRQYIDLSFDEEVSGIDATDKEQITVSNGKFIENGQVVLVKNGHKYNLNGQKIK